MNGKGGRTQTARCFLGFSFFVRANCEQNNTIDSFESKNKPGK